MQLFRLCDVISICLVIFVIYFVFRPQVNKAIARFLHRLWQYFSRPYPFQLWIAPRSRCYQKIFAQGKRGKKWPSPPGFKEDYAMFLYPDNLHTWWLLFFVGLFISPVVSKIFIEFLDLIELYRSPCEITIQPNWRVFFCGSSFFLVSYYIIHILLRRPVLDELWPAWPKTRGQEEYFKNVPARITFSSCADRNKYHNDIMKDKRKRKYIQMKTSYFHRPVFFNLGRSLQEGMLRTAIASFIAADEKRPLVNIMLLIFYFLAPVWVSFIYLSSKLMIIFLRGGNPGEKKLITVFLIVQIVIWAILSILFLIRQSLFIKSLSVRNNKLFSLAPAKIGVQMEKKMRVNKETMEYLNPKVTIPVVSAFTFLVYLALLNLVLQYETPPSSSYAGHIWIQERVNTSESAVHADKEQHDEQKREIFGTILLQESEKTELQCSKDSKGAE